MDLNSNGDGLSGSIPAEIGNLGKLRILNLGDNGLTDSIPAEIGNLEALEVLALSDNELTGGIPAELGRLDNLIRLNLVNNDLDGMIPRELGGLEALEQLNVGGNELTGSIPSTLGDLGTLTYLGIQENPLSGPLPLALADLSSLETFLYNDTDLCVPHDTGFRSWLGSLTLHRGNGVDCASPDRAALEALYNSTGGADWTTDTNWMSDEPIGDWYGVDVDSTARVTALSLRGNNLSGEIPAGLGTLASLRQLELDQNGLTGRIPAALGQLSYLEDLWLYNNALSGPIPPEFGDLESLKVLLVYNNLLAGPLPLSLADLSLNAFVYNGTDLCVPVDQGFRSWLASIPSHLGTGLDCPATFRLEFDDISELDDWERTESAAPEVNDGVLLLRSSQAGSAARVTKRDIFDPPVTNWTASTRMARDTLSWMGVWMEIDHPRYQAFMFELGSGVELGVDGGATDTNWRFLFWDNDANGSGDGSWTYFVDYGYGTSDAIDDGQGRFNDMTFSLRNDTLRIEADSTTIFAGRLPPLLLDADATDIKGASLVFRPAADRGWVMYDWLQLDGEIRESGSAARSAAWATPPMPDEKQLRAVRVGIPRRRDE